MAVREPVEMDAEGIARVHVDSWRETYSGVLDDRFFTEEAYSRRLQFWGRYLAVQPRPGRMSVAVQDGTIVGFANAGDAVGPDAEHGFPPARPLHLFSIYLLAVAHGTGAGQALRFTNAEMVQNSTTKSTRGSLVKTLSAMVFD